MLTDYKTILGLVASLMSIAGHIPYLWLTIKGRNRPHVFTWIVWTLVTAIAFAIQFAEKAGPGSWTMGVTAFMCVLITLATFRNGEKDITRLDWVMFIAALATIPLWVLTDTPLLSIILVTLIDAAATVPTLRKSWNKPHEEDTFMYGFNIPRHLLSMMAIVNFTFITSVLPFWLLFMNTGMYLMLKIRRRIVPKDSVAS